MQDHEKLLASLVLLMKERPRNRKAVQLNVLALIRSHDAMSAEAVALGRRLGR